MLSKQVKALIGDGDEPYVDKESAEASGFKLYMNLESAQHGSVLVQCT